MKFRGKIVCKTCDTVLNQSGEPVLEREKGWCERQAIFMSKPNCEHAKAATQGIYTNVKVVWEPWEAAS